MDWDFQGQNRAVWKILLSLGRFDAARPVASACQPADRDDPERIVAYAHFAGPSGCAAARARAAVHGASAAGIPNIQSAAPVSID
jgi:hypothetical protein